VTFTPAKALTSVPRRLRGLISLDSRTVRTRAPRAIKLPFTRRVRPVRRRSL